jgi:coenzyme F420 biosynthesis associated uncharacterized protein
MHYPTPHEQKASSLNQRTNNPTYNRPHGRKLLASGVIAGVAAGAWATRRMRSLSKSSDLQAPVHGTLLDWEKARSIAVNMNRGAALTSTERQRLDAYYQKLSTVCVPIVGTYMGVELPPNVGQPYAFDRVDWINANIEAFRHMLSPLEPLLAGSAAQASSPLAASWGNVNRRIVSLELGLLLGYLARRVLGQYDVALLGREPMENGKLYYVEPNIKHLESTMRLPADQFRTWLALHETTHVYQFEAFPWVRPHFNEMLERYFGYLKDDAQHLSESVRNLKIFVDRIRSRSDSSGSWIEALMNDEQRALFSEMQALMCIIEGYSNHVMNAVGRDLLKDYDSISNKFEHRQRNRSQAEQLFAKITGLDIKIEQYRQGQAFIDSIVETHGHQAAMKVWDNPESMPTLEEIRNPARWLQRVGATAPAS